MNAIRLKTRQACMTFLLIVSMRQATIMCQLIISVKSPLREQDTINVKFNFVTVELCCDSAKCAVLFQIILLLCIIIMLGQKQVMDPPLRPNLHLTAPQTEQAKPALLFGTNGTRLEHCFIAMEQLSIIFLICVHQLLQWRLSGLVFLRSAIDVLLLQLIIPVF